MRYSTGRKRRSRLQGHRKRRRTFSLSGAEPPLPCGEREGVRGSFPSFVEYKTLRQYPAFGDTLDEFKVYGFSAGFDNIIRSASRQLDGNGHSWLTEDPGLKVMF